MKFMRSCLLKLNFSYHLLHDRAVSLQILHSTGLEFQHQVQEAKDLDQLIKIHYRYLATIHDRCLLREKVNIVSYVCECYCTLCSYKGSIHPLSPSCVLTGQFCEGGNNEGSQSCPHLLRPMASWIWSMEVRAHM